MIRKEDIKILQQKSAYGYNSLTNQEKTLVEEYYMNFYVRRKISENNKILSRTFLSDLASSSPIMLDKEETTKRIGRYYNDFASYFYGVELEDCLIKQEPFQSNDPDQDISDCIQDLTFEDEEYLNSLTEEEFEELLNNNSDNAMRQAALVVYSGRKNEKLVDRAPLAVKLAYLRMQNSFLYFKTFERGATLPKCMSLARQHMVSNYGDKYTELPLGELINFNKPSKRILRLCEQMLISKAEEIEAVENNSLTLEQVTEIMDYDSKQSLAQMAYNYRLRAKEVRQTLQEMENKNNSDNDKK